MIARLERLVLIPCLVGAAGVHAAALALALSVAQRPGAITRETSAVSLNLAETLVIEEAAPSPDATDSSADLAPAAEPAPAARDALAATAARPARDPAEESAEPAPAKSEQTVREPAQDDSAVASAPGTDAPMPAPERKPEPDARPDETRPDAEGKKPAPLTTRAKPEKPAANKSVPAAPSRAKQGATPRQARLSASPGDVRSYAAKVRARIARNRPGSGPGRGTAVVAFAVSNNGGLRYARLARSSGSGALDRAALQSVRAAAPFPPPPRAMTAKQLSFVIPFHFR